ncbi:PDZ domain-containing protein [Chitinophaga costaii]|uniref:PDZ domain-containing protein n=1 Tax=Chitinophaga costaii TaxID=1335309 RepID=A0A1C4DXH2_9BACT|nr:PDZ domain-containing protein [Chitinophaga costaii]PUZ27850.1 PDZ domain-containing protein [Chitinophaga costaii]SCC36019.1 PDZ domain-containing protein [Chitinophaga costaii]
MSKMWQTLSLAGFGCMVLASASPVYAQTPTDKDKKLGEYDEIIIKRKDGQDGKINIAVQDGKVYVDNQPLETYNSNNFSVRQRSVRPVDGNQATLSMLPPRGGIQFFRAPQSLTNQALLGVITEKAKAKGVTVREVGKDTPAEKAGLKTGDVITAIDGHQIDEPQTLFETIGSYHPGDEVSITYLRNNMEKKVSAILGKHQAELGNLFNLEPSNDNDPFGNFNLPPQFNDADGFRNRPRLGLSVLDTEDGKGAKVLEVMDGSAAATAGFNTDDIITKVGDININSAKDFADAYTQQKAKGAITVTVIRNGSTKALTIQVPKQLNRVDL